MDLIPQELCKNVEFMYSPLEVKSYNNVLMSFYKDLKVLNYDFIYEDRHDHEQTKIAGDIIKLEELLENDFSFCVDGMLASVEYYKNNSKKSILSQTLSFMEQILLEKIFHEILEDYKNNLMKAVDNINIDEINKIEKLILKKSVRIDKFLLVVMEVQLQHQIIFCAILIKEIKN